MHPASALARVRRGCADRTPVSADPARCGKQARVPGFDRQGGGTAGRRSRPVIAGTASVEAERA